MIGEEIWTVLRRTFVPRNRELDRLTSHIDARASAIGETRDHSGLEVAIEALTEGKGE